MNGGSLMQFLITAFDGKDSEAMTRRMNARPQHIENVKKAKAEGKHLYGGAILDDDGNMIGSVMIVKYPSKEILENEWLKNEPYIVGNVWQEIDIRPYKVADIFLND
jgi:uncharacterized protein YciI